MKSKEEIQEQIDLLTERGTTDVETNALKQALEWVINYDVMNPITYIQLSD